MILHFSLVNGNDSEKTKNGISNFMRKNKIVLGDDIFSYLSNVKICLTPKGIYKFTVLVINWEDGLLLERNVSSEPDNIVCSTHDQLYPIELLWQYFVTSSHPCFAAKPLVQLLDCVFDLSLLVSKPQQRTYVSVTSGHIHILTWGHLRPLKL